MPETGDYAKFTLQVDGLSSAVSVARFEATEAISELFRADLLLTSDDRDIVVADVVGKNAVLSIVPNEGEPRHFHGVVSRFRHVEDGKKISVYELTLVPALWRLRHRHDSRIFQGMTVPDILEKVLSGGGVSDYRLALSGSHPTREYCVQYRESDLAFASRLMEEEGIYYFFEHTDGSHTLVLADSRDVPVPIAAPDTVTFRPTLGAMAHSESVSRFSYAEEVQPGKISLSDFNFKKPGLSLLQSTSADLDTDLEVYDYPGEYELPGDGGALAKVRLEEWQSRRAVADGEAGCIRFTPGFLFTLSDHSRESQNRAYLLTRVRHRGAQPQMMESAAGDTAGYSCSFHCIPDDVPFRAERKTPRPTIKGVQTAIVTGPGGDEVHTDEHGRVKVQFHWDRQGKKDENSSCWIRVSQLWAGAGWGAMWIPRIGHEVIVDFIEGDPDRPIITGRVYHGANVPPYPLPAEKTKSTIKSDSSIGGGGSNELRFEDKKGQEEIYLHGQKDWTIKIEHDKNQWVGNDETKEVVHDESYLIGNDQTLEVEHDRKKLVHNDQSEEIGNDKKTKVGHDHDEGVGNDASLTVGGSRSVSIGGSYTEKVGANQTVTVTGLLNHAVGAGVTLAVGADKSEAIGGSVNEVIAKNRATKIAGNETLAVSKDMSLTVDKNFAGEVKQEIKITGGKKISVMCGDATITVEKNGNITVSGKKITVTGEGPIAVKGQKIQVKSEGAVNLEASGKVTIKGSNVGVN